MSPAAEKMELDKIGGCVFVVVAVVVPRAAPAAQTYHTHRPPVVVTRFQLAQVII